MQVFIQELGKIKYGVIEPASLTLVCGKNNAGKTYVTYALYGFFKLWRQLLHVEIAESVIEQLWHDGHVELNIREVAKQAQEILNKGCKKYIEYLPRVFATKEERFKDTSFMIQLDKDDIKLTRPYHQDFGSGTKMIVSLDKEENSSTMAVSLLVEANEAKITKQSVKRYIELVLSDFLFSPLFPKTYIASTERTGAAIFRKELYFARNRLLAQMGNSDVNESSSNLIELAMRAYQVEYALPVQDNVEFSRSLEDCTNNTSFIANEHSDILDSFKDIIGGEYQVRKDGLYYVPKGSKNTRLSMQESSSSVRSLLDVGFYLQHEIRRGDFLMIDEPELNLHPENQRRMARLFARLINAGVNVFVTTHSDYLIRELNLLIMFNSGNIRLKELAKQENYIESELLSPSQVHVYIVKKDSVSVSGKKRKQMCQTLVPADINPKYGIEVTSFDDTIRDMNRIQDAILDEIEEDS